MSGEKNKKHRKKLVLETYMLHINWLKLMKLIFFLIHGSNNGTILISIVIPYFCLFSS